MNTFFIIETNCPGSTEWLDIKFGYTTLKAAREQKTYMVKKQGWKAKEVRIVKITQKIVR